MDNDLLRDLEDLDGEESLDDEFQQDETMSNQQDAVQEATLALLASVKDADQIKSIAKLTSSKIYSEVLTVRTRITNVFRKWNKWLEL